MAKYAAKISEDDMANAANVIHNGEIDTVSIIAAIKSSMRSLGFSKATVKAYTPPAVGKIRLLAMSFALDRCLAENGI